MSKQKQTFTDPQTGEEIESTGLARWGPRLLMPLFGGLLGLFCGLSQGKLVYGISEGLLFGLVIGLAEWRLVGPIGGTLLGSFAGFNIGLLSGEGWFSNAFWGGLVGGVSVWFMGKFIFIPVTQRAHDSLARRQHFQRQRILKRKQTEEE